MLRSILILLPVFSSACLAAPIDYNGDIRPILSDKCYHCHGPDAHERKADLRLDVEAEAKRSIDGMIAIIPGDPDKSELMVRALHKDPEERMPPKKSHKHLTKKEIAKLRQWIAEGAPWAKAWTYVPPKKHPVPDLKIDGGNWIDAFILKRLQEEGIKPASEADKRTLIRRLVFDLTGLPPHPKQVRAFVDNKDPGTYEKLVDYLLSTPQFGERMAVYWLDLVRYADTVGYHGDQDQNISPYRDYVIKAFNENVRFDQFTREQLAGDLLENPTQDQRVATGYNRMLQTSHEGGVQPKEYLAIYAADRIRNVSNVWMGATVGCAQCHDHKFDPYSTKDFYAMVAFFADVDEAQHFKKGGNSLPTKRPPEIKAWSESDRKRLAKLDSRLAKAKEVLPKLPEDQKAKGQSLIKEMEKHRKELEQRGRMCMVTQAIAPRDIRVLPRGNWLDDSGPIVQPAIPEFMGSLNAEGRATRLDLANWFADVDNGHGGLTARVMANRFWYLLFGEGLARILEDFGGQGEAPSHPELLDNLAMEFIASGWDMKHMMKFIVMSDTYQQSSLMPEALAERDPENRLLARQNRYRLPAEMVRDAALHMSGLLVLNVGGPSVKPYQPEGYYRHLNFPTRKYAHHTDERQWRRGLYVHWQRQFLHPMLKAFDAPSREECTARRPRSNTPLAALALLNDPTFVEAARNFAVVLAKQEDGIGYGFEWVASRPPDAVERKLLSQLLEPSEALSKEDALRLTGVGLSPRVTDIDGTQLGHWTEVARALLNLNETFMRN